MPDTLATTEQMAARDVARLRQRVPDLDERLAWKMPDLSAAFKPSPAVVRFIRVCREHDEVSAKTNVGQY